MVDDDAKRELTRAYSRGYNAGAYNRWPTHKPPTPPNRIVAEIVAALRELRDVADSQCAFFGEDDEVSLAFEPAIERADRVLVALSAWLLEPEDGGQPEGLAPISESPKCSGGCGDSTQSERV